MVPPAKRSAAPKRPGVPPPRCGRAADGCARGRPARAAAVPPPDLPETSSARRHSHQQGRPSRDDSPGWNRTSVQCSAALVEPVVASAVDCTELLHATWHAGDDRKDTHAAQPPAPQHDEGGSASHDSSFSTYQCGRLWDNNFIAGAPAATPEPAVAAGQLHGAADPSAPPEALHSVTVSLEMAEQKQRRALQEHGAVEAARGHEGLLDAQQQQQNMDVALSGMQQQQERQARRRKRAERDAEKRKQRAQHLSQQRALLTGAAQQHAPIARAPVRRARVAPEQLASVVQPRPEYLARLRTHEFASPRDTATASASILGAADAPVQAAGASAEIADPVASAALQRDEAAPPLQTPREPPCQEAAGPAPPVRRERGAPAAAMRKSTKPTRRRQARAPPPVDPDATGVEHWLTGVRGARHLKEPVAPQKVTSLLSHLATFEPADVEASIAQVVDSLGWMLEEVRVWLPPVWFMACWWPR